MIKKIGFTIPAWLNKKGVGHVDLGSQEKMIILRMQSTWIHPQIDNWLTGTGIR